MIKVKKEFGNQIKIQTFENAKEAVEPADIVLIVTTARKPVVMFEWLKKRSICVWFVFV